MTTLLYCWKNYDCITKAVRNTAVRTAAVRLGACVLLLGLGV